MWARRTRPTRSACSGQLLRIAAAHPDDRVVVVTHGGSLRRIQVAAVGMALPVIENCAVWEVFHENGAFRPID